MKIWIADLQKLIDQQEEKDGVDLSAVPVGTVIGFQTQNSYYTIKKIQEDRLWTIQGGDRFPESTKCKVRGSTWGGAAIKVDWLGEGMCLELLRLEGPKNDKLLQTSTISKIYLGEEPTRRQ